MSTQDIQQQINKLKQKRNLDEIDKNYLRRLQQRLEVKNLLSDVFTHQR